MAAELACQIVLEDFSRPQDERKIFTAVEKTTDPKARAISDQMEALYLRATGDSPSNDIKSRLLETFVDYATLSSNQGGPRFDGQCKTWEIWGYETDEERDLHWSDPTAGMRAWTLILRALMASYPYLHG